MSRGRRAFALRFAADGADLFAQALSFTARGGFFRPFRGEAVRVRFGEELVPHGAADAGDPPEPRLAAGGRLHKRHRAVRPVKGVLERLQPHHGAQDQARVRRGDPAAVVGVRGALLPGGGRFQGNRKTQREPRVRSGDIAVFVDVAEAGEYQYKQACAKQSPPSFAHLLVSPFFLRINKNRAVLSRPHIKKNGERTAFISS